MVVYIGQKHSCHGAINVKLSGSSTQNLTPVVFLPNEGFWNLIVPLLLLRSNNTTLPHSTNMACNCVQISPVTNRRFPCPMSSFIINVRKSSTSRYFLIELFGHPTNWQASAQSYFRMTSPSDTSPSEVTQYCACHNIKNGEAQNTHLHNWYSNINSKLEPSYNKSIHILSNHF